MIDGMLLPDPTSREKIRTTKDRNIRLMIITWNLGNAAPGSGELDQLLIAPDEQPYDLIAIGMQESTWAVNSEENGVVRVGSVSQSIEHAREPSVLVLQQRILDIIGGDFYLVRSRETISFPHFDIYICRLTGHRHCVILSSVRMS
jgi:hypothetical protein